jgi:hypothetical protein
MSLIEPYPELNVLLGAKSSARKLGPSLSLRRLLSPT